MPSKIRQVPLARNNLFISLKSVISKVGTAVSKSKIQAWAVQDLPGNAFLGLVYKFRLWRCSITSFSYEGLSSSERRWWHRSSREQKSSKGFDYCNSSGPSSKVCETLKRKEGSWHPVRMDFKELSQLYKTYPEMYPRLHYTDRKAE